METRDEIRVDAPATLLANNLLHASFGFFVPRSMRASARSDLSSSRLNDEERFPSFAHASLRGLLRGNPLIRTLLYPSDYRIKSNAMVEFDDGILPISMRRR